MSESTAQPAPTDGAPAVSPAAAIAEGLPEQVRRQRREIIRLQIALIDAQGLIALQATEINVLNDALRSALENK